MSKVAKQGSCTFWLVVLLVISTAVGGAWFFPWQDQPKKASVELLGGAWDLRQKVSLRVLVIPNRELDGWRDSFVESAIGAVHHWRECIEAFSKHYGFTYLENLQFEASVMGLNASYSDYDIIISWVRSFPSQIHLGKTYLEISKEGQIQLARIHLPLSIYDGEHTRTMSDAEMQNVVAEEFGHSLGLGHSNIQEDMMFGVPTLGGEVVCHSTLDIYGLAIIYSYMDGGNFGSTMRSVVTLEETNIPYLPVDMPRHDMNGRHSE